MAGLGDLLNVLFGRTVMTPGPTSVTAQGPFAQYGMLPPTYTSDNPTPSNAVAPSTDLSALFAQYGEREPSGSSPDVSATPPQGPLDPFFPNGATPQQQDALSLGVRKGLNAAGPLLLGAGLVAANSFGTGQPFVDHGWRPGPMQFARPSDALAKLMMAQPPRQRRRL